MAKDMDKSEFFEHRKKWITRLNDPKGSFYSPPNSSPILKDDLNWISDSQSLEVLSDWIKDEHCWMKTILGGNPNDVKDRRIFIEKTPRVFDPSLGLDIEDWRSWIQGYKGHADEGDGPDLDGLEWEDEFSKFIGYR
jgi:hypothetical protein